jgi:hypothetical protein
MSASQQPSRAMRSPVALAPSAYRGARSHLGLGRTAPLEGGMAHRRVLSREILPENILYGTISSTEGGAGDGGWSAPGSDDAGGKHHHHHHQRHHSAVASWNHLTRFTEAAERLERSLPTEQGFGGRRGLAMTDAASFRAEVEKSQAAMLQYRAAALVGSVRQVFQSLEQRGPSDAASTRPCSPAAGGGGAAMNLEQTAMSRSRSFCRSGTSSGSGGGAIAQQAPASPPASSPVAAAAATVLHQSLRPVVLPDVAQIPSASPRAAQQQHQHQQQRLVADTRSDGIDTGAAGRAGRAGSGSDPDGEEDVTWLIPKRNLPSPSFLEREAFKPVRAGSSRRRRCRRCRSSSNSSSRSRSSSRRSRSSRSSCRSSVAVVVIASRSSRSSSSMSS